MDRDNNLDRPAKVPDIALCKNLLADLKKCAANLGLAYMIITDRGSGGSPTPSRCRT
ncbi:hypothetical protein IBTHAUMO2_720041 [Nitrosopumilaceae archaeon]|nr:hypothetical protein IBTHAUMO2_720041 [Nitrosopumilaceae archaeon]